MLKPVLLFVFLLLNNLGFAQTNKKVDKKFHLYILMGQSNMAGRGAIEGDLINLNHSRVYMLNKDGEWQVAKNPVHFDKPSVAGVGPGLSFGIEMAKADSTIHIGLIPCAVGGTAIEKWQENTFDEATKTYPYDDALNRINNAMQYGVVKGMLWHQGESNSGTKNLENYIEKLDALITKIRAVTKNKKLPVVVGELGQFSNKYSNFNQTVIPAIITKVPYTILATSENLTDKGDHAHFDGPSANEYGKRFALKMQELQKVQSGKSK